jgi:hypothetical protein
MRFFIQSKRAGGISRILTAVLQGVSPGGEPLLRKLIDAYDTYFFDLMSLGAC